MATSLGEGGNWSIREVQIQGNSHFFTYTKENHHERATTVRNTHTLGLCYAGDRRNNYR